MRTADFRWSQIRVSLFIAIAGIVMFAAIFYFGLVGSPLSRDATVHAFFDDVSGLGVGSPVELSGVIVGQVANVDLPLLETGKVPVVLAIERRALASLGESSVAYTGSHALVGQRYIGITVRKATDAPLKSGASLQTRSAGGFEEAEGKAAEALADVKPLMEQAAHLLATLNEAVGSVTSGQGTLGRLVRDDELYDNLDEAAANAKLATGRIARGRGALGALIGDRHMAAELRSSARALADTADRIRQGKGVVGRLTNDDESAAKLDRALANVDNVAGRLAEARGTLGALISDPTMLAKVNMLLGQMDSLVSDVHRNPQRYLHVQAF